MNILTKIFNYFGYLSLQQVENEKTKWIEKGKEQSEEDLATELFNRGGFATIQLNPLKTPRMSFINPEDAVSVDKSKAGYYGFDLSSQHRY